jgi:16S rRNA (guanine1516-N2)-methyltransferase
VSSLTDAVLRGLSDNGFALETIADEIVPANSRLVLRDLTEPRRLPLTVDFLDRQLQHRLKNGIGKNQPIARALGLKSLKPEQAPSVFDGTAGLGVDAFFIAAHGCRVRSVERSPVVAALLADGYRRLLLATNMDESATKLPEAELLTALAARLSFEQGDARAVLDGLTEAERPDIVYLDPMYPVEGRSESALPKKGMQMFKRLLGGDDDASEVFAIALVTARSRVVVKRPLYAPPLGERPSYSFEGKTARLDMYLRG